MHDFEAANSDELELKRGDVVLVVPTASVEDQVRPPRAEIKNHRFKACSDDEMCVAGSWLAHRDEGKRLVKSGSGRTKRIVS